MTRKTNVAVIGAGAAGLACAGRAAELGCVVTLFEKNKKVGVKLSITGKGRCNVTNDCTPREVIENIPTNPKFMFGALNFFPPAYVKDFFEGLGVPLKTERGNRVFPVSDRAKDVVDALKRYCTENGVEIVYEKVNRIVLDNGKCTGLETRSGFRAFDRVIVCTGGLSYPRTGSDGDGFTFAREAGLKVRSACPSLVPLETEEGWSHTMPGLSLKNAAIKVTDSETGKKIYSDFGEMLFTHTGVSGPMVLSASAHMKNMSRGRYKVRVDLKPALDERTLDRRILSDFAKYSNRNFENALGDLLPRMMIPVVVKLTDIPGTKKVNVISNTERKRLGAVIKDLCVTVKSFRPISEAIITSGGVEVTQIDPRTMQAKNVEGLFFAGEVIDVDAYTGGFNLQIAFSTAFTAAGGAAERNENNV